MNLPRFQFRLRTLLIVVTLLAVLCGAVTWVIQDRQRLVRERDDARQKEAGARAHALLIEQKAVQAIRHADSAAAAMSRERDEALKKLDADKK